MTPDPFELLRQSHKTLQALAIPHGLIGGWAVTAWGRVRATKDFDWLAHIPAGRRKEVQTALAALGEIEWRPPGEDDPIAGLIRVVPHAQDDAVIEVILAGKPADREALTRCRDVPLGGGALPAVRPEDLVAMKLEAGGGLDLEDAQAVLTTQADALDEQLLEDVCRARRVGALLKRIRAGAV